MTRWLELLAERAAKDLGRAAAGHVARLNGLDLDDARRLAVLLRARLSSAAWDVAVVDEPSDDGLSISLDQAIEWRNDKTRRRLFLVPTHLESEAAASLNDTAARHVAEWQRPIADDLKKGLPAGVRAYVDDAVKRQSDGARVSFLTALPDQPKLADVGREQWRLGLIPDAAPTAERLTENRDTAKRLANGPWTVGALHQRVAELGLGDSTLAARVVEVLRDTDPGAPNAWLERLADPALSFDLWTFPGRETVDLQALHVHALLKVVDGVHQATKGSGLEYQDGTLFAPAADSHHKVTIHWSTTPTKPSGKPVYEVAVVTADSAAEPLLTETRRHGQAKNQSWSFRPSELVETVGDGLRVKVQVTCHVDDQEEPLRDESEEFVLKRDEAPPPRSSAPRRVRSLPDFRFEVGRPSRRTPEVTQRTVDEGGVHLQLDGQGAPRLVPLNAVLVAAERQLLARAGQPGRLCLHLSEQTRWTAGSLATVDVDPEQAAYQANWYRRHRGAIFRAVRDQVEQGQGLVETALLATEDLTTAIVNYGQGWAKAVDELAEGEPVDQQALADLLLLDTIEIRHEDRLCGVILSPLHPLRLLWHLGHEALLLNWLGRLAKEKQATVEAGATEALDGGAYPAFLSDGVRLLQYSASLLFHWPLFLATDDPDPAQRLAEVRWALELGDHGADPQRVAADRLGERIKLYREQHPYVRTLQLNAVNAGDGRLLAEALANTAEAASEEGEEKRLDQRFELRLYGSPPIERIGAYLDECAGQRRRGQGLPERLERLFRSSHSFLRPHLLWAKRKLADLEQNDHHAEPAHLALVTEYFRPSGHLLPSSDHDEETGAGVHGLTTTLHSALTAIDAQLAWVRTVYLPDKPLAPHPCDNLTRELVRQHRAALSGAARAAGGAPESWPAARVRLDEKQFKLFDRLHDGSDWVLTVDRLLGVELFDSPQAGELAGRAERYLTDYAPQPVGNGGQQLMISTAHTEEVSGLLAATLAEMRIAASDLACHEVLRLLKSISGRLLMQTAGDGDRAKVTVSLAIVREVLRGDGDLAEAFLLPIDDHVADLRAPDTGRRADLLLVCPDPLRKSLRIEVIEVKYRHHRSLAYDRGLWSDMDQSTAASEQAIREGWFPREADKRLDLAVKRAQLKGLCGFYIRRAARHGLVDSDAMKGMLEWLDNLERPDVSVEIRRRGYVYCPDLDLETEEHSHGGLKVTMIGRGALPRYTTLQPAPEPAPPAGPRPAKPPEPVGDQPSTDLAPAPPPRTTDEDVSVLLGAEEPTGEEVYYRLSLRSNPHALIVGIPGTGKTTAIVNLCASCAEQGLPPFVVDFHGDLAAKLGARLGSACQVLDARQGLPFNPLEVDPARRALPNGWVEHLYEVTEILGGIYPSLGELQLGSITEVLQECYEAAGWSASNEAVAPAFEQFWRTLQARADSERELKKVTIRLRQVFMLHLFGSGATLSLPEILSRPTVLNLSTLSSEETQRFAASFFLHRIYRDMFNHGEPPGLRNVVVFDEAHRVAKLKLIPKMMQESRKYGIAFVVSSQRVVDFDQGVLDSAANHLYLKVNHPDAKRLAPYLGGDVKPDRLQNLPDHNALFRSADHQPFTQVKLRGPETPGA